MKNRGRFGAMHPAKVRNNSPAFLRGFDSMQTTLTFPVPLRLTVCGLLLALSLMFKVAVRVPVASEWTSPRSCVCPWMPHCCHRYWSGRSRPYRSCEGDAGNTQRRGQVVGQSYILGCTGGSHGLEGESEWKKGSGLPESPRSRSGSPSAGCCWRCR